MTKCKLMVLLLWCAGCMSAQAQVNCSATGKLPLVCLIPFTTNASVGNAGLTGVATAAAIDGSIGAQLSQLPLAVSAPGTAVLVVKGNPEVFDNLGPILVDRPDSVGRGNLVFGFNFQQFTFNHLDGISLASVPFAYFASGNGSNQYIEQQQHISFKYNQYVALATYGLPKNTDVTVIVPYARVSIGAGAISATAYNLNTQNQIVSTNAIGNTYVPGFANGIGDVAINVKHVLWSGGEGGRGSLAAGGVLRLPTGDALNYLGSGAYGVNLYALTSYKWRVSPHAKIAYQWNTNSVLLNPSGTGPNRQLPGGVQFVAGADYGVNRHLTISGDVISTQSANANSIAQGTVSLDYAAPPTPSTTSATLTTVNTFQDTYTTANFSGGLKWKPFRKMKLILYGNVLLQLNNVGLRPDPSPSGGISYSFKTR
jgi:hypothetical protein